MPSSAVAHMPRRTRGTEDSCKCVMRFIDNRQAELVRVRVRRLYLDDTVFEHDLLRTKGKWTSTLVALKEHLQATKQSQTRERVGLAFDEPANDKEAERTVPCDVQRRHVRIAPQPAKQVVERHKGLASPCRSLDMDIWRGRAVRAVALSKFLSLVLGELIE